MQQEATELLFDWKRASFEEAEIEVQRWGDKLGRELDPLIVPVVAGLNLCGIKTAQSCEGHLDHGFAYPWVLFKRPICSCYAGEWRVCEDDAGQNELEAYHASDRLREMMGECPHRPAEALKLAALLASFYAVSPPTLATLIIEYTGAEFYRLIPIVSSALQENKTATLARCQAEMERFATFLKVYSQKRPFPS